MMQNKLCIVNTKAIVNRDKEQLCQFLQWSGSTQTQRYLEHFRRPLWKERSFVENERGLSRDRSHTTNGIRLGLYVLPSKDFINAKLTSWTMHDRTICCAHARSELDSNTEAFGCLISVRCRSYRLCQVIVNKCLWISHYFLVWPFSCYSWK